MTRSEVEEIAAAAADKAAEATVRRTLAALGIDTEKPLETQADFLWLRSLRLLMNRSVLAAVVAIAGLVGAGIYHTVLTLFGLTNGKH